MKLTKSILYFTLVCVIIYEISCFHSKNRLKNKLKSKLRHKRSETMPDYLKALDHASENAKKSSKGKKVIYLVNRGKNKTNKTKVHKSNPDILLPSESELDLVHKGWLKVSSPSLLKSKLYPRLTLPDWQQVDIPTERNFFRINDAYNPFDNDSQSPPGPYFFFMRLSKRNLFYGLTKSSIEIAGAIQFKDVRDAIALPDFARSDECFIVEDAENRDWTLCAEDILKRNKWVCMIRDLLGKEEYQICKKHMDGDAKIPLITQKITQPILIIPLASPFCNQDYNYNELGADWECECREGKFKLIKSSY